MRNYLYKLALVIVLIFTSTTVFSGGSGVGGLVSDFTELHVTGFE